MNPIENLTDVYYGVFNASIRCISANKGLSIISEINYTSESDAYNLLTDSSMTMVASVCSGLKPNDSRSLVVNMRHCGVIVSRRIHITRLDDKYHVIGYDYYTGNTVVRNADLMKISRQAREFAHVLSHYVRNHSSSIQGLLEMINPAALPPEERCIFDMITSEAVKLDRALHKLIRGV